MLAHPSFPAKTIGDVVAIAKKEGSKFNIGTSAVGTGGYLSAELFKSIAGIDAAIIPYKGTGQVMNDLLGNHVPIAFGVLPPALGNLQAGTLRAIAVLSPKRFSLLPDVPTASESGLPGFESVLHYGVLAPAGTPRPIIDRLNAALRALVDTDAGQAAHPRRGRRSHDLDPGGIRRATSTAKKRSGARWCASSISRWNEPRRLRQGSIAKFQSLAQVPRLKSQGSSPKAQARSDTSMRSPSGSSTET